MANFVMSKVVGDVISDNFRLKKFHRKGGGVQKCKFLSLEETQPNVVHIICGPLEG